MLASVALMVPIAVASPTREARAQGGDTAAAEAIFNKGMADLRAGRYAAACPSFEESYRLDPRPGVLFTLAACEEKAGRIASAVARYDDYLRLFSRLTAAEQGAQKGREKVAAREKEALEPTVPRVRFVMPEGAPPGTSVMRDDVTLGKASLGMPLPIDPGEHAIVTQVPGGPRHTEHITVRAGENTTVQLVLEQPSAHDQPRPLAGAGPPSAPSRDAAGPGTSFRGLAIGSFALGAAGLVVGAIAGGVSISKKSVVDGHCDAQQACDEEGYDAATTGKELALVSTIGFAVAGVAAIAGVVFLVTEPRTHRAAAYRVGVAPMRSGGVVTTGASF